MVVSQNAHNRVLSECLDIAAYAGMGRWEQFGLAKFFDRLVTNGGTISEAKHATMRRIENLADAKQRRLAHGTGAISADPFRRRS